MLAVALTALIAVLLIFAIEVARTRPGGGKGGKSGAGGAHRSLARREPEVEERMQIVVHEVTQHFGEIFVSYRVWRLDQECRLEVRAADPWKKLSEFTRSIVVRHLWRALEAVAGGSVVIVDAPAMRWNREIDAKFKDGGADPFAQPKPISSKDAPQYFRE